MSAGRPAGESRAPGGVRLLETGALDAVTEVLRETGRLAFMRGVVEQDGALIAAYSATIRKPSKPR